MATPGRLAALLVLAAMTARFCVTASGDVVDLATVPPRKAVQLTIYNPVDLTLVREIRALTLKKGRNTVYFAWTNTLIDPSSIELKPLAHADEVELLDTVFPGGKPQYLLWNIESRYEGDLDVLITYFASGLSWAMDYTAIADPSESTLNLNGFITVTNNSGETFENAVVRVIVGRINLTERIADLARRKGLEPPPPEEPAEGEMLEEAYEDAVWEAEDADVRGGRFGVGGGDPGHGAPRRGEKKVVKEGLSEFFIFTVEGTEDLPTGWSKKMRAISSSAVPFDILYRMRDYQYGPRPVRFYLVQNDPEHKLGESPLPDGLVRLYRDNGRDGLAFLVEQPIEYTPVKSVVELKAGEDDLVTYESRTETTSRMDFRFDPENALATGWNELIRFRDTIRNYRSRPIRFELRRVWSGDVELTADAPSTSFDYRTVETVVTVQPMSPLQIRFTAFRRQGENAVQERVVLK